MANTANAVTTAKDTQAVKHPAGFNLKAFLQQLAAAYPTIKIVSGSTFSWSPAARQITYRNTSSSNNSSNDSDMDVAVSILHEVGHALLDHKRYKFDIELLQMEVDAWEQAKTDAPKFGVIIDDDHVQDCLDSYRDWLYRRSICPTCTTKSLQLETGHQYRCFNCNTSWHVTPSRFCRPYRRQA